MIERIREAERPALRKSSIARWKSPRDTSIKRW